MMIGKAVHLLLFLTIHVKIFSQSAYEPHIWLSNYTIKSSLKNTLIGRVLMDNAQDHNLSLTGQNAQLFKLKKDQLFLSSKGKQYFKNSNRASLTIQSTLKNGSIGNQTFTLLKDEFAQNKVIAHRGAWRNSDTPQNSIASLQAAIALKVCGTEFDIHLTADGIPVINHDPDFQGTPIEKTTYSELLKNTLSNGEPIPTFESFLLGGMQQQKTKLVADLKPSVLNKEHSIKLAEKVIEIVNQLQAQAWMLYISFDYEILKRILELDPHAHTQYLKGNVEVDQLKADGIQGADYHFSIYKRDDQWIQNAHKKGILVNVWTVNDIHLMNYFLDRNIDYLTTDEPESLLDLILQRAKK
jgi:glycerophosphoryl diester phosphodiesterase